MTERAYRLNLTIENYKSYYDGLTQISLVKPLTVLAGPNGEGKSNLLESLLVPSADFISTAHKFKQTSLFSRQVPISTTPSVTLSFYDLIFQDHLLRSVHRAKSDIGAPQRFDPEAGISEGRSSCRLNFQVTREKGTYEKTLADFAVSYSQNGKSTSGIDTNHLDDFDILYANSDSLLVDFLVHLFSDEIIRQWEGFPGAGQRADYVDRILSYFPEEEERLIRDISEDGFLERFLGDTHRFLRHNLATGAKKEVLIYLIGLILERFTVGEDNLLLVILDEIESGINVLRQKLMIESLVHMLQQFPEKQAQVKIVLSTHSPVVFSELGKRPELAEVYYVLREDNAPTHLYRARDGEKPKEIEKKILLELGLNVFELPRRVIFVEGETDQAFLSRVFADCHITPLYGGNLPKILRQLLTSMRLAWEKQYTALVDQNMIDSIREDIERIQLTHAGKVKIDAATHGCDSLEEFLLNIDLSKPANTATLWSQLEARFDQLNEVLEELGEAPFQYDVANIRSELEPQKKRGVTNFVESLKSNDRFYCLFGEHWRELLAERARDYLSEFRATHQLSYRA